MTLQLAVRAKIVHGGANETLEDNDDHYGCLRANIDTINVVQSGYEYIWLGPKQKRYFSVKIVQGDKCSYRFAREMFLLYIKSNDYAKSEEKLTFV